MPTLADMSKSASINKSPNIEFTIYPNPTTNRIRTKASLLGASYTLYSSSGALIRIGSKQTRLLL